jgi:DNA-binding FrmR family transcriptional regulator
MTTEQAENAENPTPPAEADILPPLRLSNHRDVVNRLKRIEGQVRGLIDMVENGRGCEEVAQQMAAARKAMDKAFYRMMTCSVMEAMAGKESELNTFRDVERSTRILEKYA